MVSDNKKKVVKNQDHWKKCILEVTFRYRGVLILYSVNLNLIYIKYGGSFQLYLYKLPSDWFNAGY